MQGTRATWAHALCEEREGGRLAALRSPALEALGVPHGFTTRHSACTPFGPRLAARVLVRTRQVHGARVFASDGTLPAAPPEADALVGSDARRALAVVTADCVPILVAGADGRRVAAIHAGWRGLVAGVIPAALAALGDAPAAAAIGPCLARARFEVGPEVAAAFEAAGLASAVHACPGARPHVDLRAAARLQLAAFGVPAIDGSNHCTWQDAAFFSHRQDVTHGGAAATGRQGAWIAPRPVPGVGSAPWTKA